MEELKLEKELREVQSSPVVPASILKTPQRKVTFELEKSLEERKEEEQELRRQLEKSQVVPKQKEELPIIPVEELPLIQPTVQTTVEADRVIKSSRGTIIQNPRKVTRSEYIPRENIHQFHRSITPGRKTIAIEPVYTGRNKGVPVRAIKDFSPVMQGQVSIKKGEAVMYLGKGENEWSLVQKSDRRRGFVPHSYLSK